MKIDKTRGDNDAKTEDRKSIETDHIDSNSIDFENIKKSETINPRVADAAVIGSFVIGLLICGLYVYLNQTCCLPELASFMRSPLSSTYYNLAFIILFISVLIVILLSIFFGEKQHSGVVVLGRPINKQSNKIQAIIIVLTAIAFLCAGFIAIPFLNTQLSFY